MLKPVKQIQEVWNSGDYQTSKNESISSNTSVILHLCYVSKELTLNRDLHNRLIV